SAAGGRWRQLLSAGASRHARTSRDDPDAARPADRSRGRFEGATWTLEWLHLLDLGAERHLTIGLDGERVSAASAFASDGPFGPFASAFPDAVARTGAVFTEARAGVGARLTLSAAARLDAHSRFGRAGTHRLGAVAQPWTGARVHATLGTGFTAPTLFQLFDPQFGDPALEPERSRGWDGGIEQDLAGGRLRIGVTVFRTRFEGLIGFAFPDGYANIRAARTRGVEATLSAVASRRWRVTAAHTALRTRDETAGPDQGAPLLRRPRQQAALDIVYSAAPLTVAAGARWVGPRDDLDFTAFPALRVTLEPYAVVRFAAGYNLTPHVQLHARLENALDTGYAEVLHFNAPGRAAYGGVSVAF
ncbi:MAG: TonB-dependent receptor, partial [Gemmatimonadota bacterium]